MKNGIKYLYCCVVCVCRESCDCRGGHVPQDLQSGIPSRAPDPRDVCGFFYFGSNHVDRGKKNRKTMHLYTL